MAVGYSPKIILDGLSLTLDAGVPTSWNAGISTNWRDKVGGNNGTLVNGTSHTDGPFVGAGYVEFDGTDDHLSISDSDDLDLSTGDFTIEFWVYAHSLTNFDGIVGKRDPSSFNSNSWRIAYGSGNSSINLAHTSSNSVSVSYAPAPSLNTWTHYAFARESGTMRAFKNGVKETDVSSYTHDFSNTYSLLIAANASSSYTWDGYISNVRVVKGTALYTSNFTPPTKPLTAITNTSLLTCQGNTITDASSSAHTITSNGAPSANLGSPVSAFEFDGTDDYILLDSGLGIGTDDFAISVWVKFDSVSGASGSANFRTVLSSYSGGLGYIFGLWISGNPVFEHYMDGTSYKGNTTIVAGTWYNMVSTRLSGDLYLYLNGSLDNTPVSASTKDMADTATPRIGWIPSASQNGRLDGTVSDLKVYKGKGLTAEEVQRNYDVFKGRYV